MQIVFIKHISGSGPIYLADRKKLCSRQYGQLFYGAVKWKELYWIGPTVLVPFSIINDNPGSLKVNNGQATRNHGVKGHRYG